MKGFARRADVILVACIILAAAAVWIVTVLITNKGDSWFVQIDSPGQNLRIPTADTVLDIQGITGQTRVRIKNKEVWVEKASCPNKLCARQGRISKPGETIVCLPNRIVITIEGREKTDAITY